MFIANCYHSSQPSEHPSTSDWPTSQPSESPSLSSQPSDDPTPSPSNAPINAVSCRSVWSIVYLDFSHKVQYICFYIYSPPLNQRRALLQPRPVRWVVEMFVIVYPWLYYPNQYLSYDIFVIFHFYIADLSTNVEPYCDSFEDPHLSSNGSSFKSSEWCSFNVRGTISHSKWEPISIWLAYSTTKLAGESFSSTSSLVKFLYLLSSIMYHFA